MDFITDEMVEAACKAFVGQWNGVLPFDWASLRTDMRAALVAAMRAAWRPIESAPKDGTRILVATSNAIHSACWDKIDHSWRVIPKTTTKTVPVPGDPLAWQPLPPPPAKEGV